MPRHSHTLVPVSQAEGVFRALCAVYGARADAVADAAAGHGGTSLDEARAQFIDADAALDLYGWEPGPRLAPAELAGPSALVSDVLQTALIDAVEQLATLCDEYHAARASLADLRAGVRDVDERLALFEAHEAHEST
jgi:hypothetical protein